jgi:GntR family transcriptional regulator
MNESPELILDGGAPIWRQITKQIRQLILCGILKPGEELPTVRAVAVGLGVNPHAVEQAYRELEEAGLVQGANGGEPRVAISSSVSQAADLEQRCDVFLRGAVERGHSLAAIQHTFQRCLEEVSHEESH